MVEEKMENLALGKYIQKRLNYIQKSKHKKYCRQKCVFSTSKKNLMQFCV